MKILIIGSGGREHALAWKLKQSPKVKELFVAPGNGGTASIATNIDINDAEIEKLANIADEKGIDLTVVGPETALCAGIVDEFEKRGLKIFGPNKEAAKLEGSKAWSKELLQKYNIPCGKSKTFDNAKEAKKYLDEITMPIVLKASGIAAGKGVLICKTKGEALSGVDQIMIDKSFGTAGDGLIVEEYLEGTEVSVLCFVDGRDYKAMVPACDYKRVRNNDEGLNTGGMGVYSPPKFYTKELNEKITKKLIEPTLEALEKEGINFKGILYAGVILTKDGPKILEYNCRFGDPETQVILPKLKTDLLEILESVINGKLPDQKIEWEEKACVGVVIASGGYPEEYQKGYQINGLDDINKSVVFHAGTRFEKHKVFTNGGRVLCVSALGTDIKEARETAYQELKNIRFSDMHYRTDIGLREI